MSISKKWVASESNQQAVLALYRSSEIHTLGDIAKMLKTTYHNVMGVIQQHLPEAEAAALVKLRYAVSKTGTKNPMHGKKREQHHNWQGECDDGYGYLTILYEGKRCFVHRVVMMKALGLKELPESLAVHHIDGDPKNNSLDNLALVTPLGHKQIHFLQAKDSLTVALTKSRLRDAMKYLTFPSQTTPAT